MRKLAFLFLLAASACTKVETPASAEEVTTTNNTTTTSSSTTSPTGSATTGSTSGSTTNSTTSTTTAATTTAASTSIFPALTGNFQVDMLAYVNALRTKGCKCNGVQMPLVPALKWNKLLESASLRHGNDMNTKNFFSHTGSDGSTMAQRVTATGYLWSALGENIAWGYTSVPTVINGWVSSSGHCKNMMSASYTEMGAARVANYWVQDFGKPR